VAPCVQQFTGVDLASSALDVARRLGIANACFKQANGGVLPFPDFFFDAAFCYDVFTNFPDIEDGVPLINEMLRVVRPGGHVLVGNVPDRAYSAYLPARVQALTAELDALHGPYVSPSAPVLQPRPMITSKPKVGVLQHLFGWGSPSPKKDTPPDSKVEPAIVTYDFLREDFLVLGQRLDAKVELSEVHELNPYRGLRFNVTFYRGA
jgi:SAM-dependent methyltransferase